MDRLKAVRLTVFSLNNLSISFVVRALRRRYAVEPSPVADFQRMRTRDPFRVLVATILSARTKDATTSAVCARLFEKVRTLEALRAVPVAALERLIYPVGFYRTKARHLHALPEVVAREFAGRIPQTIEELVRLPGVGRKTANLVVTDAFGGEGLCVDVHVHRISNRLGLIRTRTPAESERALRALLPKRYWAEWNPLLVAFGQTICHPRFPACGRCPLASRCAWRAHVVVNDRPSSNKHHFAIASARCGFWMGVAIMACQPMEARCAEEHLPDGNAVAGPMNTPSLAVGNIFRPVGNVTIPSYAPEGSWVLLSSLSWANTWNYQKDRFIIDGEWLQLSARVSYMATEDLEIGGHVPFLARMGGFTDRFIEGFHNTFDLGNSRREGFPHNQSIVDLRNPAGEHTRWEGDRWGLSDVSLFASWTVTQGARFLPCIVLGSAVTLPTGDADQLLGSGEPGFGVSALLTKRIEKTGCLVFFGTSASYSEHNELTGIDTRKTQFGLLGGIAYELNKRVSIVVQNLRTSPIAWDYDEFSKPTNELNMGIRVRDIFHGVWEISIQENLIYFNNSADVGLHMGYGCLL